MQVGKQTSALPEPLLIENILMKLNTKADSYSSAGTENKLRKTAEAIQTKPHLLECPY